MEQEKLQDLALDRLVALARDRHEGRPAGARHVERVDEDLLHALVA
jgi:hypothetical protein